MNKILSSAILRAIKNPISSLSRSYPIFLFAFLLLLVAVVLLINHSRNIAEYTEEVNHSQDIKAAYQMLSGDTKSAQILSSEFGRQHSTALIAYLKNDIARIPRDIGILKELTVNDAKRRAQLNNIIKIFNEHVKWMTSLEVKVSPDSLQSVTHVKSLIALQGNITQGIDVENGILGDRQSKYRNSEKWLKIFIISLSLISLLLFVGISISNIVEINRRTGVESFLESVLHTSQNAIVVWEAVRQNNTIVNFRAIFLNDSVGKNGPFKADEMMGRLLTEVSPDSKSRGVFAIYKRVTETGIRESFESAYERNASTHWLNASVAKLGDGFIVTFSDITNLKNSQRDLQEKVELLEQTNSELEQFAYVASHDLQEPLRKIKTFASLINERFNEPSAAFAKVYLTKVIDSANRMSGLISDLLSLSYISDRGQSFTLVNLNEIIKNVLNDFELIIDEKKAVITFDELPVIEAIPSQMNQLFYNMIGNALKYSKDEEPPRIYLTCSDVSKESLTALSLPDTTKYFRIQVKDNGIGFDPQFSKKIFVIFQRLNNRQRFAGSGIGLALCRKIVLNHHGEIFANSKENEGSVFEVVLPQFQKAPNLEKSI